MGKSADVGGFGAVWFSLHFVERYATLNTALPATVGGWPLHPGGDFLPPPARGGGAYAYILRAVSVLSRGHRHHWSGCPEYEKEVTAPCPHSRRVLLVTKARG